MPVATTRLRTVYSGSMVVTLLTTFTTEHTEYTAFLRDFLCDLCGLRGECFSSNLFAFYGGEVVAFAFEIIQRKFGYIFGLVGRAAEHIQINCAGVIHEVRRDQ